MGHLVQLVRRYERRRRFWRQVDVRGRDECWPWLGGDSSGADARAYEIVRGPLPPGTRLRHHCGNPRCVNPEHMELIEPGQ